MKTASEIFQSRYQAGADGWMAQSSVLECMKEYGRQCAEQALKDAAENALCEWIDNRIVSVDRKSILNTPIVTP